MPEGDDKGSKTPQTFESLMDALPKEHQTIINEHIGALSRTLDRLKDDKKVLKSELDSALKNKDTDAESKVTDALNRLKDAEQRSTFYEHAVKAGVRNPRLAFIAARDAQLLKDDGTFDPKQLKESFGELFEPEKTETTKPAVSKTNAGAGNGQKPVSGMTFDEAVRAQLGRVPR